MGSAPAPSPHTFHIPIMGTGFSIDSAFRVAKYGITVCGHSDWLLLEPMRKFHCERLGEPYEEISLKEPNCGVKRIVAWLNLMDRTIDAQIAAMRQAEFAPGTDLTRYFELLPPGKLRDEYEAMLKVVDPAERTQREDALRPKVVRGEIQFNIMTKVDGDTPRGKRIAPKETTAVLGTRGFAESSVDGAVVYSAGMNPRLYGALAEMDQFRENADGRLEKRVILKVSDYRSADIQAKYLAKRGIWVSEYRIESGLNCGGHAFATQGLLLGPILEEMHEKRDALADRLLPIYNKALAKRGRDPIDAPHPIKVSVQGGIGTAAENRLMFDRFHVDETGWATPWLLVPEVTNVDPETREQLRTAGKDDVFLSGSSPLGIPFWNLRESKSERQRLARIAAGQTGSDCPRWWLKLYNTEFTQKPICVASEAYQSRKLAQIEAEEHTPEMRQRLRDRVLAKSCICVDLAGAAEEVVGVDAGAVTAVCPGPNIVNFSKIATLDEMVGHIYGRNNLITNPDRPHQMVREAEINVDLLETEIEETEAGIEAPVTLPSRTPEYFEKYITNLHASFDWYDANGPGLFGDDRERAREQLAALRARVVELAARIPALVADAS
ncbi:MAG: hypothetical protein ACYTGX_01395 [Planctomycetota bacterium]|jgi:hypothetical protein